MGQVKEQVAFLLDYCKLIQYADSIGVAITAGELQRPVEMQVIYVKTGRSKTMDSYHIKKMAGDLNFFNKETFKPLPYYLGVDREGNPALHPKIKQIGLFWKSLNPLNSAGMFWKSFKDVPHFERHL